MKYKLALFDVDSTLTTTEAIDLLASHSEHGEKVAAITERAMQGEIGFDEALIERVGLLAGLEVTIFNDVLQRTLFSSGAKQLVQTLQERGMKVGAVSGGFIEIVAPLFHDWNFDFLRANRLEYRAGKLTGKIAGDIINRSAKAQALEEFAAQFAIPINQTIAIGDGSNDIEMIELAALGISYRGKPALKERADLHVETMAEIEEHIN